VSTDRNRYRLAVLTSHPIQYQAPLFQKLANHPQIDLMVYFCSDYGVTERLDPGFGIPLKWDIPLLDGYSHTFLQNYAPRPLPNTPLGLLCPGIWRELKRGMYDAIVVHVAYTSVQSWITYLAAWLTGTPVLFRGETVLRFGHSRAKGLAKGILLRFLFKGTAAFLTIGTKSAEFYRCNGVPGERLFFTPYAVDNAFFMQALKNLDGARSSVREELGLTEDMPIIIYASKLTDRKRPMDLLQAFERLNARAALIFVGDGKLRQPMERWAKERGVSAVHFLGFKSQTELPRYYAASNLFVLPSSYEPWGLVVNEAMCLGLPIITTSDVAAAWDLVRHGENGFVYSTGDLEALTRHINDVLASPEKRRAMGRRSVEMIHPWNHDACVEGVLRALQHVGGSGPARPP
jgi:glycosyltransferase involved in cell wall biosynthesis